MPNYFRFFAWPTVIFLLLFLALTAGGIDRAVSQALFDWQGQQWTLRDSPLLTLGFHEGGKLLSVTAWLICCAAFTVRSRRGVEWREPGQKALLLLILSVALATTVVSVAKSLTHMDCPWDLSGLGGVKIYVPLLSADHFNATHGKCFPAGQASAGYAWVALFFAAQIFRPSWRARGLCTGIAFGLVLGVAQQLRGAHFLSHDLAAAWISWITAAMVYRFLALRLRFAPLPSTMEPGR